MANLNPFLLVGIGGSGGKTLRAVRDALELKLNVLGWKNGIPGAWQFLHIDTPLKQDGASFKAKFLPNECYAGLSQAFASYSNLTTNLEARTPAQSRDRVMRQLPNPKQVTIDLQIGAGQYRAVGRAAVMARLDHVAREAKAAAARMSDSSNVGELNELQTLLTGRPAAGAKTTPQLIIVSSVAGGSGAGQYLDVIDAIKAALPGQPWAQQSIGFLYAPDVFMDVAGNAAVSSNALATISETTNGQWNHELDSSVVDAYSGQGLTISSTGMMTEISGVKYPVIVGMKNDNMSFVDQDDVYLSMAQTIAAFMTIADFQDDLVAYWKANFHVQSANVANLTGLTKNALNVPTFSAMGFGRVTLGNEKFALYTRERIARSIIDRLLNAHVIISGDPTFKTQSAEEMIASQAQDAMIRFFADSGFDEESEDKNQVIDAMVDKEIRARLRETLISQVRDEVYAAANPKTDGHEAGQWVELLVAARNRFAPSAITNDAEIRGRKFADWLTAAPKQLLKTVERYAVSNGLPVTAELLGLLRDSVARAAKELEDEALRGANAVGLLASYVNEKIAAGGLGVLRRGSDPVNAALERIGDSFLWEADAINKRECAALLREAQKDFLEPLTKYIRAVSTALQANTVAPTNSEGLENDFETWPGFDSSSVPPKYDATSNEKMLLPPSKFPGEFNQLFEATYPDAATAANAVVEALPDVLAINPADPTPFLVQTQAWVPSSTVGTLASASTPSKGNFSLPQDPLDYLERAEKWMTRVGTPFGEHFLLTIDKWLDPKYAGGPAVVTQRESDFMTQLQAALKASSPLVEINPTMMNLVHNAPAPGVTILSSPIPFASGSPMYNRISQMLADFPNFESASRGGVAGAFKDISTTSVEFFQVYSHGVLPAVMASVMEPISQAWNGAKVSKDGRDGFWQWKRARLLHEAIPLDLDAIKQIIRGWYVAQGFIEIHLDTSDLANGPKLSVFDSAHSSKLAFPHPLLYSGPLQEIDYLAAVLQSTVLIYPLANATGSLDHVAAYQRLMELGDLTEGSDLKRWLTDGTGFDTSNPHSLGAAANQSLTVEERKRLFKEYVDEETGYIQGTLKSMQSEVSIHALPVIWEIEPLITQALVDLRDFVEKFAPTTRERRFGGISSDTES
jgi:hypothetical protein